MAAKTRGKLSAATAEAQITEEVVHDNVSFAAFCNIMLVKILGQRAVGVYGPRAEKGVTCAGDVRKEEEAENGYENATAHKRMRTGFK